MTNCRAPRLGDRVSVVIVTRNRHETLRTTLAELVAWREVPGIIVVDDASADRTAEMVAHEFPLVDLIARNRREGPVARNHGLQRARTPYIAFTDDDCRWQPGALDRAADLLDRHPRMAVVAAQIAVGAKAHIDPICEEMARSPLAGDRSLPGVPVMSFMGGAAIVRRAAVSAVGGFEPRLMAGGEEEPLACDLVTAGWDLRYVAEVVVHHYPAGGDRDFDRMLGIRNALWFAWRRRPLVSALRWTVYMVRAVPFNRRSMVAFVQALRGLPWVLATRRPVPPDVEARLRALDGQKMRSEARTYG